MHKHNHASRILTASFITVLLLSTTVTNIKPSFAKDTQSKTDHVSYIFEKIKTNHNLFELMSVTSNDYDRKFLQSLKNKTPKQLLPKIALNNDTLTVEGLQKPIHILTQPDGTVQYSYNDKVWTPDPSASFARNIVVMGKTFFSETKTTARVQPSPFMSYAFADDDSYFFAKKMDPDTHKVWDELDEHSKSQSEMLIDFQNKAGKLLAGAAVLGGGLLIARIPTPWTKTIGYSGAAVGLFMFTSSAKADEVPAVREFRCNGEKGPFEVIGLKKNGEDYRLRVFFDKVTREPISFIALDNGVETYRRNLKVSNKKWTFVETIENKNQKQNDAQTEALAILQDAQDKCAQAPIKIDELNKSIAKVTPIPHATNAKPSPNSSKSK